MSRRQGLFCRNIYLRTVTMNSQSKNSLSELLVLEATNPVSLFVPNGSQEEWIRMIGTHRDGVDPRTKVLSAANKIGKSASTIAILANIIWGMQSKWFDFPIYRDWPFPKIAWLCSTESALKEVLIPEMKKWFPCGRYQTNKEGKAYEYHWMTDTGWNLFLKTYEQDEEKFESALLGLCIFSEPPPESIYNAIPARMSMGGLRILEMTPLTRAAWVFDRLIEGDKALVIYADIEANCQAHGIRGRLKHSDIEDMLAEYDVDEREARAEGKFAHLGGLVYKGYDRELLVRQVPWFDPKHEYMYRMVVDPHDRMPPAVIWVRFDRFGRRAVIREWPSVDDPQFGGKLFHEIKDSGKFIIKDFCRFFIEIEKELGIPADRIKRIMDPNFGRKRNSLTARTISEEYTRLGKEVYREIRRRDEYISFSFITEVSDDLALGHKKVKELLQVGNDNDLRFIIDSSCKNVDLSFRRYKYREHSGKRVEEMSLSERLEERYKHFVDLIRYDVMLPFRYRPPDRSFVEHDRADYAEHAWSGRYLPEQPPGDLGA